MFKYGLYEVFKDAYQNLAGEELSNNYKPAIWLAGSASAEIFADIALCPLEMAKVKIQTSPSGTFPIAFGTAMKEMSRTSAETRFPFGSLVPLWSRQVSLHLVPKLTLLMVTLYRFPTLWLNSTSSKRSCSSSTLTF
jgi:solute carrier family 25 phosphate transporter 3